LGSFGIFSDLLMEPQSKRLRPDIQTTRRGSADGEKAFALIGNSR
jgi:hypothetical protein